MNLHYKAPIPCKDAAGVFLFYEDSVLLCKRSLLFEGAPVPYGGYWSPFTGTIEEGESPMVTAQRELKEESGLEVKIHELKYIKEINRPDARLILYVHELNDFFSPILDAEHSEFGYFKISDLTLRPHPLDLDIQEAIDFYCSTLRVKK